MVAPNSRLRWVALLLILCLMYLSIGLGYLYQWPWEHPDWTWQKLFETMGRLLPY